MIAIKFSFFGFATCPVFLEAFAIAINSMHWEHSAELLVLCHVVWGLSENDVCLATADRYQWLALVWEDRESKSVWLHFVLRHDIVAFGGIGNVVS